MAARVFLLSLFARRGIRMLVVMQHETGKLARLLMRLSRVRVLTLSGSSWRYYRSFLGERVEYLKTGVDTERFCPVSPEKKRQLREKYGLPQDKDIVLHVGHMRTGRNVQQLEVLEPEFQGLLVTSTYAAGSQETELGDRLRQKENLMLIDSYQPNIEELYQLSDVYLFPVVRAHNCIDVPLSAMEAAACGIPVAATAYGELEELLGEPGFYEIGSFEPEALNGQLRQICREGVSPRETVEKYDWNLSIDRLLR